MGCHPSNSYQPKWPHPPPRSPRRGIFRTLINLDNLTLGSLGKGEVESSIPSGSTRLSPPLQGLAGWARPCPLAANRERVDYFSALNSSVSLLILDAAPPMIHKS
jgi:hypothetical protein